MSVLAGSGLSATLTTYDPMTGTDYLSILRILCAPPRERKGVVGPAEKCKARGRNVSGKLLEMAFRRNQN
jgi:hypothetical protein